LQLRNNRDTHSQLRSSARLARSCPEAGRFEARFCPESQVASSRHRELRRWAERSRPSRGGQRRLLRQIPGIELVEAEICCGSAGTYNLTEPETAQRLLHRKLDDIQSSCADIVAAANPGCLLQIRAGTILEDLPVEIAHPIEILARAHGIGDEDAS
jgi:hypothetical protein